MVIDGHDKLRRWGIEIYAAIDAYARRIQCINIGITNRAQVAVAKQYLEFLKAGDWCPKLIRADRGQEVVLLADAHLRLYYERQLQAGLAPEALDDIPLSECFLFGPSTANQRIENW